MEFWNNRITEKSYQVLLEINSVLKNYGFEVCIIGGWAVWLYARVLKSKDIDIIVDHDGLNALRSIYGYIHRNDRLRKYDVVVNDISIDIYVKYYSDLIIPVEEIMNSCTEIDGFSVPSPEILVILKQQAEFDRGSKEKGLKDRVDILSLLLYTDFNIHKYLQLAPQSYYERLLSIVRESGPTEFRYLNIRNYREIKEIKKELLEMLEV